MSCCINFLYCLKKWKITKKKRKKKEKYFAIIIILYYIFKELKINKC